MLCKGLLYEILYYYILKSRRNSIVCVSCRRAVAGLGARRTVREASSHVGTRLLLPVLITTHSCPHISLSHTQFTVPCLVQIKKTRMNGGLGPEQKAAAARRRLAPLAPQNAAGRAQPVFWLLGWQQISDKQPHQRLSALRPRHPHSVSCTQAALVQGMLPFIRKSMYLLVMIVIVMLLSCVGEGRGCCMGV